MPKANARTTAAGLPVPAPDRVVRSMLTCMNGVEAVPAPSNTPGTSENRDAVERAQLRAQLEAADRINQQRLALWQNYYDALAPLAKAGRIELPSIPDGCVQNAHMFYIKLRDIDDRSALINFLKEAEIMAVFHYIPLHGCPAGEHFGEFHGEDRYTTKESERLLRLPLFYNLSPVNQRTVIATLLNYFS